MQKLNKYVLIILTTVLLSSCSAYKSVNIGDVNGVDFRGMVDNKISLELKVPIANDNGYKLKIKKMDLDVTINGRYLGKMVNAREIVIPSKSDTIQVFPVDIEVKNILSSMSSIYKLRKSSNFELQIEGTIKVKALLHTKTIKVSEKQMVSI